MIDRERFHEACREALERSKGHGIGTLGEKTLHAALKRCYSPYEDSQEIQIGSFVADIVGEHGIIEIQTRNFAAMRKKLDTFLEVADVTVVYPVAKTRWVIWTDPETGETKKNRSPKKGSAYSILNELYFIKNYITHPRLSFRIVMLGIEEHRLLDGWSKDKKRGATRCDRIPVELYDEIPIEKISDYSIFIPESLDGQFTSADYKKESGISLSDARVALNVLLSVGAVKRTGKSGNNFLYERAENNGTDI